MTDVWPRERPSPRCSTTRPAPRGGSRGAPVRTSRAPGARRRAARTSGPCCRCCPSPPAALPVDEPRRHRLEQQRVRPRRAQAPGVADLCACHSPFRYAWHERRTAPWPRSRRRCARPWPPSCAATGPSTAAPPGGVDRFLANSQLTRRSGGGNWGRDFVVVLPPGRRRGASRRPSPASTCSSSADSSPHKRADIAIEAAVAAGRRDPRRGGGPGARAARGALRRAGRRSSAACPTRSSSASTPRAAGARRPERRGVRDRGRRGPGRGPAGRRRRRGRRPRDGRSRGAPGCSSRRATATRSSGPCAGTSAASTPPRSTGHAQRFSREAFQERLAAAVDEMIGRRGARRAG